MIDGEPIGGADSLCALDRSGGGQGPDRASAPGGARGARRRLGVQLSQRPRATAVAVYALLAFIAARALTGLPRLAVATAGAALVLVIGASRVYLGVHYPTDVIAGWLTGAAIALAAWWATEWIREQRQRPTVA